MFIPLCTQYPEPVGSEKYSRSIDVGLNSSKEYRAETSQFEYTAENEQPV